MSNRHLPHTHGIEVWDCVVECRHTALRIPRLYSVRQKLWIRRCWLELLPVVSSSSVADSLAVLNDVDLIFEKQLTHISVKFRLTFASDISSLSHHWLNDLILSNVVMEFCSSIWKYRMVSHRLIVCYWSLIFAPLSPRFDGDLVLLLNLYLRHNVLILVLLRERLLPLISDEAWV